MPQQVYLQPALLLLVAEVSFLFPSIVNNRALYRTINNIVLRRQTAILQPIRGTIMQLITAAPSTTLAYSIQQATGAYRKCHVILKWLGVARSVDMMANTLDVFKEFYSNLLKSYQ